MCLPIRTRGSDEIRAWVAAVPFLRPADLVRERELGDVEDPLVEGVRHFYAEVFDAMHRVRKDGQKCLGMGHLYLRGGALSELSERKVLGGNQHALPVNIFPDWVDYVALGHLHRAQAVGSDFVYYSGAPLALSMDERHYPHQVNVVCWENDDDPITVEHLRVPRAGRLFRIPDRGSLSLEDALLQVHQLDVPEPAELTPQRDAAKIIFGAVQEPAPWLEVAIKLDAPEAALREKIEAKLEGKPHQLVKLSLEYSGDGQMLGERVASQSLEQLRPEDVFEYRYQQLFGGEAPPDLRSAFFELLENVQGQMTYGSRT